MKIYLSAIPEYLVISGVKVEINIHHTVAQQLPPKITELLESSKKTEANFAIKQIAFGGVFNTFGIADLQRQKFIFVSRRGMIDLLAHLPRYTKLAAIMAGHQTMLSTYCDHLRAQGWRWQPTDPTLHLGYWHRSSVRTDAGEYDTLTTQLYAEYIKRVN